MVDVSVAEDRTQSYVGAGACPFCWLAPQMYALHEIENVYPNDRMPAQLIWECFHHPK